MAHRFLPTVTPKVTPTVTYSAALAIILMGLSMVLRASTAGAAEAEALIPLASWQEASVLAALEDPSPAVRHAALGWLSNKQTSNVALAQTVAGLLRPGLPAEDKQGAAEVLGHMGAAAAAYAAQVVPLIADASEGVRQAAANAVVNMGPKAADAVAPQVAALLKDPGAGVRYRAAQVLGHFGPAGAAFASQVAALLDEREPDPPTGAAEALSNMGPAGTPYASRIAQLLAREGDGFAELRSHAAQSLSRMGPAAVAVLPQIAAGLQSPDPSVRAHTASSLGDMVALGPPVTALAPQVAALLQDPERRTRFAATYALGQMGPAAAPYARAVAALLNEDSSNAPEALGRMGPAAAPAVPDLLQWLDNPDNTRSETLDAVADALGKLGPAAAAAVPRLAAQLKSRNPDLRVNAVVALGHLGRAAAPVAPQMVALLKDEESSVNRAAQTALGQLNAAGVPVAARIVPLVNDRDRSVALRARTALAMMRSGAAAVVSQLEAMLHAPQTVQIDHAAPILEAIGPAAARAAPQMVEVMGSLSPEAAGYASLVAALKAIGPAAAAVVAPLTAMLQDPNSTLRSDAADILGSIGPAAAASVPQLAAVLQDPDPKVRRGAATALGNIGAAAAPWGSQVLPLLGDPELEVRVAALRALDLLTPVAPLQDRSGMLYGLAASHVSQLEAASFLLRAYVYRKVDAPDLILIRRLGNRKPAERAVMTALDRPAALRALQTFSDAWDAAAPFVDLRREMAEAIAELAPSVAGQPQQAALLVSLQRRLAHEFPTQGLAVQAALDNDRWYKTIYNSSWLIGSHIGAWVLLLLAYPRWRWVQSFFFWSKWPRRFFGCFYVGVLITIVPFLRRRMFMPFKASLLPQRLLEQLNERAYFAASEVRVEKNRRTDPQRLPLQNVLAEIRGQVVLKGHSGLGKTQLLLRLAQRCREPVVFLRATECAGGVIAAIQTKVHGQARDAGYLRTLIYGGGLKVLIDGLNEASPDARTRITQFVEEYFTGDFILTTQPIAWEPPATARIYVLQPLLAAQIEPFLLQQWASVQERATLTEEQYAQAVAHYLKELSGRPGDGGAPAPDARLAALTNPMDATLAAELLARGEIPDTFRLVEQGYRVMAGRFREREGRDFRLHSFAERIYEWRASGEPDLRTEGFEAEVAALVKERLMIERTEVIAKQRGQEELRRAFFRHDRIMEFFLLPAFMGAGSARQQQHDLDEPFWGVYELLAARLPDAEERRLHRYLIERSADTHRSELVNRYTLARRVRSVAHGAERHAAPSAA